MSRDALVVGINCYQWEGLPNLRSPAKDAENIAQILEKYGDFQVWRLPEFLNPFENYAPRIARHRGVTLEQLEAALVRLFNSEAETALFFFSGHGLRKEEETYEGFLATSDVNPEAGKWGLSLKWLRQLLRDSPVRQQIVWLDCCHGGELFNFVEAEFAESERFRLDSERLLFRDRCFIAASRAFETAYSGVLSSALLRGLDPTQQADGRATNYTLEDWIGQALKDIPQHIVCKNTGGQIILTGKSGVLGQICPYKRLNYFDFNDEDPKYFYGRTALIKQLLEKVQQSNFLAVLGPLDSGKSSVVRAGLLYQLKLGAIPGSDRWEIYQPFTPGVHPCRSLEQAIGTDALQLESVIKANPAERIVLVIDQFEEVFTQCRDKTERQQFLECLMGAVERGGNKLCLVLVMRSDFFGKCTEQEYTGLSKQIEQNLVTVLPMSQAELREAIAKPAEQVGLELDRELINQMIADLAGSASDLPLMQYTLTELWEKRTLNRLTISDYIRLGGVKKALEKQANKVYQSLPEEDQLIAKRIFMELTRLGEGTENTRRQVFLEDLVNSQQSQEQVERVVQCLANAKLLVTSEQELKNQRKAVVNIVHETLIRNWDLLGQWLEKNQVALLKKQDIEDIAQEWRDNQKRGESAYLLRGTRLAAAEDYLERYADTLPLSSLAHEFVQKSIKYRRNSRIRLVSTVIGVIGILTGLTIFAFAQLQLALLRGKASEVENLIHSATPVEGLVLAIEATGKSLAFFNQVLPRVKSSLLDAVEVAREGNVLRGHQDTVWSVAISENGKTIVSGSRDGTVRLWDAEGNSIGKTINAGEEGSGMSVAISADGQTIAISSTTGQTRLWVRNGNPIGKPIYDRGYGGELVAISADGQTVVTLADERSEGHKVKVWDREGNSIGKPIDAGADMAISADGQTIVTVSGGVRLWSREGEPIGQPFTEHQGSIFSVAISADGQTVVSGGWDGFVRLSDREGKPIGAPFWHENIVTSVAISADGQTIASGVANGTVQFWSRAGFPISDPLGRHRNQVESVAISADGQTIISGGEDGTVRLWPREDRLIRQVFVRGQDGGILDVAISPDAQTIISVSRRGIIRLRDFYTGQLLKTLAVPEGFTRSAISADGQIIVTGSGDGTGQLWDGQGNAIASIRGDESGFGFYPLAISSDGQRIVSGSEDGTLRLLDRSGNPIGQPMRGGHEGLHSVAMTPDGQTIVTASEDGTVRLWDRSGNPIGQPIKGHESEVYAVAISPDGQRIVSGEYDGTVRLWDRSGNPIGQPFTGHRGTVTSVAISPDGQYVVSGSMDGTVRFWRGGNWKTWLNVACNRLRFHPVLVKPETDVAGDARETCQKYVWRQTKKSSMSY